MKFNFQYLIALISAFVTGIIFFLILKFSSLPIFFALVFLWFSLLTFLYLSFKEKRRDHTLLLTLSTALSSLLLFSIIDDPYLRWFFVGFVVLLFGILFGVKENSEIPLEYGRQPFRRFSMMIWVFNAYALFSYLFALGVLFQSEWPVWLEIFLVPGAGIIAGFLAGEIWKMYVHFEAKTFFFFRVFTALFISEVFWSLRLLPFGYLVSGILLTWLWYVLQMLVRFHFQPSGIIWKKQLAFLITSAVIFLFLSLFFVRWI